MSALDEVKTERERQQDEWGDDHDDAHTDLEWSALFQKHVGMFADDAIDWRMDIAQMKRRHRAIVIAALAVAYVEALDRRENAPQEDASD